MLMRFFERIEQKISPQALTQEQVPAFAYSKNLEIIDEHFPVDSIIKGNFIVLLLKTIYTL